jgi:hypothetical protein
MEQMTFADVIKAAGVEQIEFILYNKEGKEFERRLCKTIEDLRKETGEIAREHGQTCWMYVDLDLVAEGAVLMLAHMGYGIVPGWIAETIERAGVVNVADSGIQIH